MVLLVGVVYQQRLLLLDIQAPVEKGYGSQGTLNLLVKS